jgi:8-oxo-dGTP pyrophosphatase MutT (NUDIX family)
VPGGALEVLLVTSRETRRWVIPKGWPWPELADHLAAAEEAREEAGLLGAIESTAFGTYVYQKRFPDRTAEVGVDAYLLWVAEELEDWPERAERRRVWFTPDAAAEAVEEPQLRAMLRALADLPRSR